MVISDARNRVPMALDEEEEITKWSIKIYQYLIKNLLLNN